MHNFLSNSHIEKKAAQEMKERTNSNSFVPFVSSVQTWAGGLERPKFDNKLGGATNRLPLVISLR
jgi:hypothetical protein